MEGNRIALVGADDLPPGRRPIVYPGCAIIPGFVNAHAHLELTLFHGLLENLSFSDWIARLVRLKYQKCTRDALKVSAQLGAMEMLRAGITTVGEVMDVGTGWEAMLEFGLQGVAYQEVFGPAEGAAPEALRALAGESRAFTAGRKRQPSGLASRPMRHTPSQRGSMRACATTPGATDCA